MIGVILVPSAAHTCEKLGKVLGRAYFSHWSNSGSMCKITCSLVVVPGRRWRDPLMMTQDVGNLLWSRRSLLGAESEPGWWKDSCWRIQTVPGFVTAYSIVEQVTEIL